MYIFLKQVGTLTKLFTKTLKSHIKKTQKKKGSYNGKRYNKVQA